MLIALCSYFDVIIVGPGRNIHRFNARKNVKIMYSITDILADLKNS